MLLSGVLKGFLLLCFLCLAYGEKNSHRRKMSSSKKCVLNWLHPPRVSATFCLSMQHACNETRFMEDAKISTHTVTQFGCVQMRPTGSFEGNRNHDPVTMVDIDENKIKNFVTVLSKPSSRMIACFCDGLQGDLSVNVKKELLNRMDFVYGYGSERKNGGWKGKWGQSEELCIKNFKVFAEYPASYGCYTKMLNGFDCMANVTVTPDMVDRAIDVLKQFLFVGLEEDYELSVRMFLKKAFESGAIDPSTRYMHDSSNMATNNSQLQHQIAHLENVKIELHNSELTHVKTGSHLCAPILNRLLEANQLNYTDPYDSIVYKEAVKLFVEERRKYESRLPVR